MPLCPAIYSIGKKVTQNSETIMLEVSISKNTEHSNCLLSQDHTVPLVRELPATSTTPPACLSLGSWDNPEISLLWEGPAAEQIQDTTRRTKTHHLGPQSSNSFCIDFN